MQLCYNQTVKKGKFCEVASTCETLQHQNSRSQDSQGQPLGALIVVSRLSLKAALSRELTFFLCEAPSVQVVEVLSQSAKQWLRT